MSRLPTISSRLTGFAILSVPLSCLALLSCESSDDGADGANAGNGGDLGSGGNTAENGGSASGSGGTTAGNGGHSGSENTAGSGGTALGGAAGADASAPGSSPDAGPNDDASINDASIDAGFTPPELCQLQFDPGPCLAAIPVYAFVNGSCVQQTYGGCSGNENRFSTLEECWATCQGQPSHSACPEGYVAAEICLECGLAGGCAKSMTVCALQCDDPAGCEAERPGFSCFQNRCQLVGCR
jgi:hypothetical protein